MKTILLSFFVLVSLTSEAQYATFWNTRTQKNPAFQVLDHKHEANVTHRNTSPALSGFRGSNTVSFGTFLKGSNSGVGFYYNNESWTNAYKSNAIKFAYNYQMPIGEELTLSVGTGVGAIFSNNSSAITPDFIPSSGTSFGLDVGSALSWRKLHVGVGIQNVLDIDDVARMLNKEKWTNFTGQYIFGKETGFQFIPQVLYETNWDFHTFMWNAKAGYKNKYFLSFGSIGKDEYVGTAEILVYQKVRLTYSFIVINSNLSQNNYGHEFGLSLEIGKR